MTVLLHLAGHAPQTLASPEGVRIQLQNYWDNFFVTNKGKLVKNCRSTTNWKSRQRLSLNDEGNVRVWCDIWRSISLRIESRLNRETARYITNNELTKRHYISSWLKRCELCTAKDALYLHTYRSATFYIEEYEQHVLIACPRYHEYSLILQKQTKSILACYEARITTNSLNGNMYHISVGRLGCRTRDYLWPTRY